MSNSSSLKYHYWYGGVKALNLTTEADMLVMIRGSEFEPNKEISYEDDNGHMGTSSTLISNYRSEATSEPEFQDYLRYCEGWEDILLCAIGSDNGEGAIDKSTLTNGVYQYNYGINQVKPQAPYFMTLKNGYSLTDNDAWLYEDCLMDSLEVSGSNTDAPTYDAKFISNYPKFRQPNVARTIPATTIFPKPHDVKLYIAPVGTYADIDAISSYAYPCYTDWNLTISKNVTGTPCSDDDFGTSTKTVGDLQAEFSCTLLWNELNKRMEYDFASASEDDNATTVSTDNYYRTIWIVATGSKIGSTDYNYQTIFKLPKVNMTKVDSPQSGTDEKTLEIEGTATGDSFVEATVTTSLSDLHITNPTP